MTGSIGKNFYDFKLFFRTGYPSVTMLLFSSEFWQIWLVSGWLTRTVPMYIENTRPGLGLLIPDRGLSRLVVLRLINNRRLIVVLAVPTSCHYVHTENVAHQ